MGYQAGYQAQQANAVAIGNQAGYTGQGANGITMGYQAGYWRQGTNAVAIGNSAGYTGQHANTIILNATGAQLNSDGADRWFVAPIRNTGSANVLYYNSTSKEITYAAASGGATGAVGSTLSSIPAADINIPLNTATTVTSLAITQGTWHINTYVFGSFFYLSTSLSTSSSTDPTTTQNIPNNIYTTAVNNSNLSVINATITLNATTTFYLRTFTSWSAFTVPANSSGIVAFRIG